MEKIGLNRQIHEQENKDEESENLEISSSTENLESTASEKLQQFIEQHLDLFTNYARGRVQIVPAPAGLDTFAFDLNKNIIYGNDRFFRKKEMSDEKTAFAFLHEIEHFLEKVAMLKEEDGEKVFKEYLDKIGDDKAYSIMDNLVADIRENKSVVSRTHEGFRDTEIAAYKEDLFPELDYTDHPQHIQFLYGLFRENRVPDEGVMIDQEARKAVEKLLKIVNKSGRKLIDVMTDPHTQMSVRIKLQDTFIWPIVEKLRTQDLAAHQEQEQKKKEGEKESSENSQADNTEDANNDQSEGENNGDDQEHEDGDEKDGTPSEAQGVPDDDPNEIFKDSYKDAENRIPPSVSVDELKKELEEYIQEKEREEKQRDPDQDFADRLEVPKKDLLQYRKTVAEFENYVDPETNTSVIEALRNLIKEIITGRKKKIFAPQYPLEEGDELIAPAEMIAEFNKGNIHPAVWQENEIKEFQGEKFGEVEITLVCDRSGSMSESGKAKEQQKATILFLEALREFAEMADAEKNNLIKGLEVRSEVYTFQSDKEDAVPVKEMSKELGEAERIRVATRAGTPANASTTDFVPLSAIQGKLAVDRASLQKIKDHELKKIVIVFTDGGSDDPQLVQETLHSLKEQGVVVVGVGVTQSGRPALDTYAPQAVLAEKATDLPKVLKNILQEHLSDI
jgi:hypothetical protein